MQSAAYAHRHVLAFDVVVLGCSCSHRRFPLFFYDGTYRFYDLATAATASGQAALHH
jgi:hypothetical protein